tara:strand:+ start:1587 stop:2156 length:570 start_codon:yes stop_codon:yes gene_type:complete
MDRKKILYLALSGLFITGLIVSALLLADYITQSERAQQTVVSMGYIGVLAVAVVGGLNSIAPVPPAVFVPIFTASGLLMPIIIAMLILGTTIADLIGYFLGKLSKEFIVEHYPKTYQYISKLNVENKALLFIFVLLYASAVPFPNEAFLIPLGILGVPLYRFLLPMILGTTLYHTATAYGAESIFQFLF